MVYTPLKTTTGGGITPLKPTTAGYTPLGGGAVRTAPKIVEPVKKFETPPTTLEQKAGKLIAPLQPKEGENIGMKSLKFLGRMVIAPFKPLAEDILEIHAVNEISKGVSEGRYDPKILDEFEILKKSSPQVVGDVAQAVIAVTPLRALNAIKGLPILSKVALTTLAKTGAQVGAGFGVAEKLSERPEVKPTELATGAITGAIGGALAMPAFGIGTKVVSGAIGRVLGKGISKIAPVAQKELPEPIPPVKGIIPQELQPLAQEARKYKSAEDFTKAFQSEIKHGEYWHITDNPNFTIDLKLGPRDMSSLAAGKMTPGKLMVTSDLEYWAAGYPNRKFAAKLDFSAVKPEDYTQVNRGFGNEFFVKDPSKVKVEKVIPIEQALKESEQFQKNLEGIIRSKQDIADFWAQSQLKTGIPKQLEPLVIKAKGAKSFDEFVKQFESVGDKFCIDF